MRINSFLRWTLLFLIAVLLSACDLAFLFPDEDVAEATGEIFEIRNNNVPYFDEEDYSYADEKGPFTELSPLDELGRVGVCWGLFDYDHMPTYDREQLDTEPTGWHQKKYGSITFPVGFGVDGLVPPGSVEQLQEEVLVIPVAVGLSPDSLDHVVRSFDLA